MFSQISLTLFVTFYNNDALSVTPSPELPDRNFGNQEIFSEVQEIFISSLKEKISIFFLCIIEN